MHLLKVVLLVQVLSFSLALADDEVKFSGYGSTGFIVYERSIVKGGTQESYYEGKLQADIKINKDVEGQLDFRGSSFERAVELKEFSLKLEHYTYFKVKVGNIKLPFGHEQLVNREMLPTIERSNAQRQVANLGYGGRSFGIMFYYKYSEKRPDMPFSWFVDFYKDNSSRSGVVARGTWHKGPLTFGANYQFQHQGGRDVINSNGFAIDALWESEKAALSAELSWFLDPLVSLQHRIQNEESNNNPPRDENVYGSSFKLLGTWRFDIDTKMIRSIEPLYMFSVYFPNMERRKGHELQHVVGANIYISKKTRIRLQGDMRFSKTLFADEYSRQGSRFTLEFQIRFNQ